MTGTTRDVSRDKSGTFGTEAVSRLGTDGTNPLEGLSLSRDGRHSGRMSREKSRHRRTRQRSLDALAGRGRSARPRHLPTSLHAPVPASTSPSRGPVSVRNRTHVVGCYCNSRRHRDVASCSFSPGRSRTVVEQTWWARLAAADNTCGVSSVRLEMPVRSKAPASIHEIQRKKR